jgi:DNA-binding transcriptional LysR family regulator
MEIFELRYFLSVARFENIHRASEHGHVSPAALSKAVTRLEGELGVKLFSREGRQIRLTEPGRELQRRASELVRLEEDARLTLAGQPGALQVTIAAPEILLARFGSAVGREIRKHQPRASFELIAADDAAARGREVPDVCRARASAPFARPRQKADSRRGAP